MWRDSMFWVIKIFGLGMWVAILSIAIVAIVFKNGTEKDAAFVFLAIMDLLVIVIVVRAIREGARKYG